MRAIILGCGGAAGVPAVGSGWGACDPANPRNRRLRPSILVEEGETRLLVDTSPDLRQQLLSVGVNRLSGVVYTHDHADHIHGIDDLREVNRAMQAALPLWASAGVLDTIGRRFPYVMEPMAPGSTTIYKPLLEPHVINGPFSVGSITVGPFDQDHGYGRSLGFRFERLAYSTDVVEMPEDSFAALAGIEVWILGCLVDYPHPTHAHIAKALDWIDRVKPRRAVLTHMGSRLDYDSLKRSLPPHVEPAWDGMVIDVG